ncbi:MAG: 2-C-methyl-D-erythritol 2,4-cyclodiphosphate synthase [Epulopiscium sp. Nele67-Bin005]|nr:MAG: 2-C-methyl-D-erythritol 2,4-cyclodiphosphate synthase [Epulopiscium sp. Nele67-Bin005]
MLRIGTGYDVHKFAPNRDLILGGVTIPHHQGLLGHSDADVLVHAIIDALLGACAFGDIGKHFPDNDENYKNISSIKLLEHVQLLLEDKNITINNIDATIIAQKPKLAPYIQEMRKNISNTLKIDISQISIKATTEEGLGFTGKEEGIATQAVTLINKQ